MNSLVDQSGNTVSDFKLYGRLLTYAFAYKWSLFLSFLGYVVYSLGNVLLADLSQFLLDSLGGQPMSCARCARCTGLVVLDALHAAWP